MVRAHSRGANIFNDLRDNRPWFTGEINKMAQHLGQQPASTPYHQQKPPSFLSHNDVRILPSQGDMSSLECVAGGS
jgi:hypothetical protein